MDQEMDPWVPLHTDLTWARQFRHSLHRIRVFPPPHGMGKSLDIQAMRHRLLGNDNENHKLPNTNVFSGNNMAAMPEMLDSA